MYLPPDRVGADNPQGDSNVETKRAECLIHTGCLVFSMFRGSERGCNSMLAEWVSGWMKESRVWCERRCVLGIVGDEETGEA